MINLALKRTLFGSDNEKAQTLNRRRSSLKITEAGGGSANP